MGFWNLPRQPNYDTELIAIWRMYARLHQQLAGYSYSQAQLAHQTGMPIIRPLFLVDASAPEAWKDWETYLYDPDLLVSLIWEKRSEPIFRATRSGAMLGTAAKSIAAGGPSPSRWNYTNCRLLFASAPVSILAT